MKIEIPQNCRITNRAILKLKNKVKDLINHYEEKYQEEYKIYLYQKFLKIHYKKYQFVIAIVEYNEELFWYMRPFYKSYLLLKDSEDACFDVILFIIKNISEEP